MAQANEESLDAEVSTPWGKVGGKNLAINTLLTLAIGGGMIWLVMNSMNHNQDTKEASAAFVAALKEQTVAYREGTAAQREQNCLLKFKQEERQLNENFCKQISGVQQR